MFHVTQQGIDLQNSALASGSGIVFTRVGLGEAEPVWDGGSWTVDWKLFPPVVTVSPGADGTARITAAISNIGLPAGFPAKAIGLYARLADDPENEILYAYRFSETEHDYIPAEGAGLVSDIHIYSASLGPAPALEVIFNDESSRFVSALNELKGDDFSAASDNLHKIRKAIVGLYTNFSGFAPTAGTLAKQEELLAAVANIGGGDATLEKQNEVLAAVAALAFGDATLAKQNEILSAISGISCGDATLANQNTVITNVSQILNKINTFLPIVGGSGNDIRGAFQGVQYGQSADVSISGNGFILGISFVGKCRDMEYLNLGSFGRYYLVGFDVDQTSGQYNIFSSGVSGPFRFEGGIRFQTEHGNIDGQFSVLYVLN